MSPEEQEGAGQPPLPFATATIARLYLLQGKLVEAEAMYRRLLDERPDDARLLEGLAEVQGRQQARLQPLPGEDRLELDWKGERLRCRYVITPEGERRARRLTGGAGDLVLRVMAFPPETGAAPIDQPIAQLAGELELPAPEGARVLAAAVGVRAGGDQFAAIAHGCTAAE
jgi:hypothetical protein